MVLYKRSPTTIAESPVWLCLQKCQFFMTFLRPRDFFILLLGCRSSSTTCKSGNWQCSVSHPYSFNFICRKGGIWLTAKTRGSERERLRMQGVWKSFVWHLWSSDADALLWHCYLLYSDAQQRDNMSLGRSMGGRNLSLRRALWLQAKGSSVLTFAFQQWADRCF